MEHAKGCIAITLGASRALARTAAVLCAVLTASCSPPTAKPASAAAPSHMEEPWLRVTASYRTEDAANICRLSVRSNLKPNVPRCLAPTIGLKRDSS